MTTKLSKSGYQEVKGNLGFFGWLWHILFWLWQIAMVFWIVSYTTEVAPMVDSGGAEGAGAAIGATIGVGFIIAIWCAGSVIFGIFVLLTRRSKAIIPK